MIHNPNNKCTCSHHPYFGNFLPEQNLIMSDNRMIVISIHIDKLVTGKDWAVKKWSNGNSSIGFCPGAPVSPKAPTIAQNNVTGKYLGCHKQSTGNGSTGSLGFVWELQFPIQHQNCPEQLVPK